ncbi:MAG: hypothetical protein JWN03_2683 [Nocardia sp.]|uniref:hypothetical protein n=1 Tax=Nocardia sp. TaxID=1821 RepID=UPI002628726C|nr:hypothetical protein [Nocardia sp.]MCU1642408.1 hypothetical protein [Nocardia sp.]
MQQLRLRLKSAVATAERPLDFESATRLRRRVRALSVECDTTRYPDTERVQLNKLRNQAVRTVELAVQRADETSRLANIPR